jgi:aromatic ring hydroxylase
LHDGRCVYIDGHRIPDGLQHAQTLPMARSLAQLMDHELWAAAADDQWSPLWSPSARPEQLRRKGQWYRDFAALTGGILGRSPDFLAAVVTAWRTSAEYFGHHAERVVAFHEYCRKHSILLSHAISDPPAARSGELNESQLQVVERSEKGIVVSGLKMLATLGPFADYLLVYPYRPLHDGEAAAALCFALPVSAPGLRFHLRPALYGESDFVDSLLHCYDESDAVIEFDRVFIPNELIFIDGSVQTANGLRGGTALTTYAWHQAASRGWAKTQMIADLAYRCAQILGKTAEGTRRHLGEIQAQAHTLRALLDHAERHWEHDRDQHHICCGHSALSVAVTRHASIAS